jgi:chromosomal replication initiation ATPase DnaA
MEEYCLGQQDIVCGYAGKEDQDYQSFNEWLGDSQPEKSVLVYINTNEFKKTIYDGDLSQLTVDSLSSLVNEIRAEEAIASQEKAQGTETTEPASETTTEESQ